MQSDKHNESIEQIKGIVHASDEATARSAKARKPKTVEDLDADKYSAKKSDAKVLLENIHKLMVTDSVPVMWTYYRALHILEKQMTPAEFKTAEGIIKAWIETKQLHFLERRMTELR